MTKVLIADDAIHIRTLLKKILEVYGMEVEIAEDGQQALDKYDKSFDLVFMDINMPKVFGLTVIEEILKEDPDAKICMLSAQSHPQIVQQAFELGAKDYVVKPFSKNKILETIEQILNIKLEVKQKIEENNGSTEKMMKDLNILKEQIKKEIEDSR